MNEQNIPEHQICVNDTPASVKFGDVMVDPLCQRGQSQLKHKRLRELWLQKNRNCSGPGRIRTADLGAEDRFAV